MAIVNKGFPGTVNATEYAKSWHLGGADAATGWAVTQGTGRQTSVGTGDAFAAGVLSTNSAPILTSLSTPVAGQWFLIVRRIDWAGAGTVTVEAIPHTTTTTTVPSSTPSTYPTYNDDPGVLYDHKLGWAWVRNTDTTMELRDLREIPLEPRLQASETEVATLRAGPGRADGAVFSVTDLPTLDAIATAKTADVAQVRSPGTGVDAIFFTAISSSGSSLNWRLRHALYADTKAHLDTVTTTIGGIANIILRPGDTAYAEDTKTTYRWSGAAWTAVAVGLMAPTVNSSTGTSAVVGADNTLTLTAITAVVLTAFTDSFENYDIEISGTKAVAGTTLMRLATAGTVDPSGANHDTYGASWTQAGVTSAATVLNQATFYPGNNASSIAEEITINLSHPKVAKQTRGFVNGQLVATIGTSESKVALNIGHRQTTSFDGFQLLFSQAFTGTVKVKPRP